MHHNIHTTDISSLHVSARHGCHNQGVHKSSFGKFKFKEYLYNVNTIFLFQSSHIDRLQNLIYI